MNDNAMLAESTSGDSKNKQGQYLTFLLNGQEYAVDILQVQGIQGWSSCTDLPNTPEFIRGVINLRGAIVPIFDLRMRFSMPLAEYNELTVVVVVKVSHGDSEKTVGMVVDAVSEVYNISSEEMNPPPEFGTEIELEYIESIANFKDNLVILLNVEKLICESLVNQLFHNRAA